ncbi:MAG: IS200/IS605 family element transposase accessory protein TnpB [Hydrococcus sp. C42_A2020_068]|nr:IS200/IS605 family element transposase accessory protein TnpB [Hydrococcus sp. C42_A2020_068]
MAKDIIQKAFKFRISKPSKIVQANLEQTLNLARDLYNCALQERRDAYKLNRISLNYYDQANQLREIKQTNPEYKEIHSQVLQDVLKRLDKTFKAFYSRAKQGKAGFPRFKSKNRYDSFCFPQSGFNLTGNKLTLSKIGTVRLKLSRKIQGKVKTCQIKREIDKWFVIFTVETKTEPLPKTGQSIGIDVGIAAFATLSDGTQIDNFKYYEATQKKLRVAQRRVARRKKGSNRRRKAVLQLKKIHQKIRNQRNDFQHKVSTYLVKTYDVICIEDLNVLGLSKGFLSKQMNDIAIGAFFQKLEYKVENTGKELKKVRPHFTSQDCSQCGNRVKKDLSVRIHHCLQCGLVLDRDINAAKNILSLGLSGQELTKAIRL